MLGAKVKQTITKNTDGTSVKSSRTQVVSRIAAKQAMLDQAAIQPWLFQAGAAKLGLTGTTENSRIYPCTSS